jgi:16S rRNA (guanine1207-N2)-methyltransferase
MSMSDGFIRGMSRHLQAGGELWLVANRFLPYAEALQASFKTVRVAAETGKFVVYHALKGA